MLVLSNKDVESVLKIDECVGVLDKAYKDLAFGQAVNCPRTHTFISSPGPHTFYLLKSITGGLTRQGVMALRINSERWRLASAVNRRRVKLPTTEDGHFTEFILLFSILNGELLAILPDAHLQRSRVSATAALAAKYLARPDSAKLLLFGSGWQAETQIRALKSVLPIEKVKVFSPNQEHRERFAGRVSEATGIDIAPVADPEGAMKWADIVACATNAESPILQDTWLRSGIHVGTVNAKEIGPASLRRCDLVVVHNRLRSLDFICGEEFPIEFKSGGGKTLEENDYPELSAVVSGTHPGRTSPEQTTLFLQGGAGGEGLGIQFAAVGKLVYDLAQKEGLGQEARTDWFLDVERHP